MEATTPAVAPAPAPIPPAPPVAAAAPPSVNTAAPAAAPATSGSGSFKDAWNKTISNPAPLIFGILGSAALYYAIYYFKYNNQMNKVFVKTVENKIDDLDMKYSDLVSKVNQLEASQNSDLQLF